MSECFTSIKQLMAYADVHWSKSRFFLFFAFRFSFFAFRFSFFALRFSFLAFR